MRRRGRVAHGDAPPAQRCVERAREDLAELPLVALLAAARRRLQHARQLVEEPPASRRQRLFDLQERAFRVVAERRPCQHVQQRAAEIERAHLGEAQAGLFELLERSRAELPQARAVHLAVEDGKPGAAERVEVAADRAHVDALQLRQLRHRNALPRAVDAAQDLPLPDDFSAARHADLLPSAQRSGRA